VGFYLLFSSGGETLFGRTSGSMTAARTTVVLVALPLVRVISRGFCLRIRKQPPLFSDGTRGARHARLFPRALFAFFIFGMRRGARSTAGAAAWRAAWCALPRGGMTSLPTVLPLPAFSCTFSARRG